MSVHDVCALGQVPDGGCLALEVGGHPVAVVKSGGEVFAIENRCSHADVALSEGDVSDGTIECWLHGSAFDLRTGEPLTPPAVTPVAVYPVEVSGEGPDARIHIRIDSAGADTPPIKE